MKPIPLKISTQRIKGYPLITLISEIDQNISVNVEKDCSQNKEVLKSAKAQLSNNWRKYFYGELIDCIAKEKRGLPTSTDSYNSFQKIEQSFNNIMKSIPEFIDSAELKIYD